MFELLIVKPILNLLAFIYALLPGHNFGLALILFTIAIRLLMWPLVKKQLHHSRAMRELQPEVKRIKKAANGNRQQESLMLMALYKEREIKPFASIGIIIIQVIVLIGLFHGLQRIIADPEALIASSYGWLNSFPWMRELAADISRFDMTLLGFIDLTRSALSPTGGVYLPALVLVIGSSVTQYYQSKQLMPTTGESRSLRSILRDAKTGKETDQSEVQAATGRTMVYLIPVLIFVFTVGFASALALYWFVGGLVQYLQQSRILKQDVVELKQTTNTSTKTNIIEGEVVETKKIKNKKNRKNKRRKR